MLGSVIPSCTVLPRVVWRLAVVIALTGLSVGAGTSTHASDPLTVTPRYAAVGDVITISGTTTDVAAYTSSTTLPYRGRATAYLERSVETGFVQVFPAGTVVITSDRHVRATLRIPGTERYFAHFQQGPDVARPTAPGTYALSFPCHGCPLGRVTITAAALPFTGGPPITLALVGLGALVTGVATVVAGRSPRAD